MTIQVYPPTSSAGSVSLPYGVTETIIDGKSDTGSYSYTQSLPAGTYAFSGVSLEGNIPEFKLYSSSLSKTVTVPDQDVAYFETSAAASDFKFSSIGGDIESASSYITTPFGDASNNIFAFANGNEKEIMVGGSNGKVAISAGVEARGYDSYTITQPFTGGNVYVKYFNGKYFASSPATGYGGLKVSTDKVTWTTALDNGYSAIKIQIVNDLLFAYVDNFSNGIVYYSTDGVTFTPVSGMLPRTSAVSAAVYGNSTWVVAGSTYVNVNTQAVPNGGWTQTAQLSSVPNAIAYGNNLFVAVGDNGYLTTSPDATNWTTRTSGFGTSNIENAEYLNNLYWAVGSSSKATYSTDGVTWTLVDPGFGTSVINDIAYGNGVYVAVGNNGKVSSSTDGTTWTLETGAHATNAIYAVIYAGGQFVAVGSSGKVSTSPDGTTWTAQTAVSTSNWYRLVYANSKYVMSASNSSSLYYSTDAVTWTICGGSGTASGGYGLATNGTDIVNGGTGGAIRYSADSIDFYSTSLVGANYPVYVHHDGTQYKIVVGGAAEVYTSTNLTSWTLNASTLTLTKIAANTTGSKWIGLIGAGQGTIYESTDGITWTTASNPANFNTASYVDYLNGFFWLGGNATTNYTGFWWSSNDMASWVSTYTTWPGYSSETAAGWAALGLYNNKGWLGSAQNTPRFAIIPTTGGSSWTGLYNNSQYNSNYGAALSIGSDHVLLVNNYAYYSSANPATEFNMPTSKALTAVSSRHELCVGTIAGTRRWMYATNNNGCYISTNGTSWTASTPTGSSAWDVLFDDYTDRYLIVGTTTTNRIWYSTNGTSATNANVTGAATSTICQSIATDGNGNYIAGFNNSWVAVSFNASDFTASQPAPIASNNTTLYGAAVGNGIYVLGGTNGITITAPTGTSDWRGGNPLFGGEVIYKIKYTNGTFMAVGSAGKISVSNDGYTWTMRSLGLSENIDNLYTYDGEFYLSTKSGIFKTVGASSTVAFRLFKVDIATLS